MVIHDEFSALNIPKKEKWKLRNPIKAAYSQKMVDMKRKYHITKEEFEALVKYQDNKCGICGNVLDGKKEPAVDHNHKTGKIRGLLCTKCNTGIGQLNEDVTILILAIKYLEKYK